MGTIFDELWVIYRPSRTDGTPENIIYALGDSREAAWENAVIVMHPLADDAAKLSWREDFLKKGYRAKRCTLMVET